MLAMRVAETVGELDVDRVERLPARKLLEWWEWFRLKDEAMSGDLAEPPKRKRMIRDPRAMRAMLKKAPWVKVAQPGKAAG